MHHSLLSPRYPSSSHLTRVVVIIAIFNYIFTCMAMIVFAKNDPYHFGSFGVAFFNM